MNRPQDFNRPRRIDERMIVFERRFVRSRLPLCVTRRAIPRGRHYTLIPRDLAVCNLHPVTQRTTGSIEITVALRLSRPRAELPLVFRERGNVTILDSAVQL